MQNFKDHAESGMDDLILEFLSYKESKISETGMNEKSGLEVYQEEGKPSAWKNPNCPGCQEAFPGSRASREENDVDGMLITDMDLPFKATRNQEAWFQVKVPETFPYPLEESWKKEPDVYQNESAPVDMEQQPVPRPGAANSWQQPMPDMAPSNTGQQLMPQMPPSNTVQQQAPGTAPANSWQQPMPDVAPSNTGQQPVPQMPPSNTVQQQAPGTAPANSWQQPMPDVAPSDTGQQPVPQMTPPDTAQQQAPEIPPTTPAQQTVPEMPSANPVQQQVPESQSTPVNDRIQEMIEQQLDPEDLEIDVNEFPLEEEAFPAQWMPAPGENATNPGVNQPLNRNGEPCQTQKQQPGAARMPDPTEMMHKIEKDMEQLAGDIEKCYPPNEMYYMHLLYSEIKKSLLPYVLDVLDEFEYIGSPVFEQELDKETLAQMVDLVLERAAADISEVAEIAANMTRDCWNSYRLLRSVTEIMILVELYLVRHPEYNTINKEDYRFLKK